MIVFKYIISVSCSDVQVTVKLSIMSSGDPQTQTNVVFLPRIIVSMTYYGVTMYAGNLGGNFYLNFFLLAVVEFPAKAFSIIFLDRLGRKWVHFIYMMLGGLACIGTIFTVIYGGEGNSLL